MKPPSLFKPGDRVWFYSKFGDRVTGIYEGAGAVPRTDLSGEVEGHHVRSDNAFGPKSKVKDVLCFVPTGALYLDRTSSET